MKGIKKLGTLIGSLIFINLSATTYYVDVNGNDSNNGLSPATAWRTIAKVSSVIFKPGDRILFKRGQIFPGSLWPKGSGIAGAPITINAFGSGNRPVIQASTEVVDYAVNGGFEFGLEAWSGVASLTSNGFFSKNAGQISAANTGAYQVISGLTPNTTYTLEAHTAMAKVTDQAVMYAKNFGGQEVQKSIGNSVWTTTKYDGANLTFTTGPGSTSVEIGFWKVSGADNFHFDDVRLTRRSYAVKLENQHHWVIRNIETTGGSPFGICVLNTIPDSDLEFIRIINCVAHDVAGVSDTDKSEGCIVIRPSAPGARINDVIIDGCTAYNTKRWGGIIVFGAYSENRRSRNITIRNSTVYNVYGDGILEACVVDAIIENCVSHDVGNMPENRMGTPNGIWQYFTDNGTVRNCEAYNTHSPQHDGGGFDIDILNKNCTVEYCYAHDNDAYGVAVFAAFDPYLKRGTTVNSVVRYNLFYNNGRTAPTVGGDGCDQGDIYIFSWNNGDFDGVQIYNNTSVWQPVQDFAAIKAIDNKYVGTLPNFIRNNIIQSNQPILTNIGPGIELSNNLYFFTDDDKGNPPSWIYNGKVYNSLLTYNTESGEEWNSIYADPLFESGSVKLSAGSAATNAGTYIFDRGPRDYYKVAIPQGQFCDIGAAESYNLALNPGFDKGNRFPWSVWLLDGYAGVTSFERRSGSHSGFVGGGVATLSQEILELTPNTTYTASGYVLNESFPSGNVYFGVKDAGTDEVSVAIENTNDLWKFVSINFKTGPASNSALVYLYCKDVTTWSWIDDVEVRVSELPGPEEPITSLEPEQPELPTLSVFPNPARGFLHVQCPDALNTKISILNLDGRAMHTTSSSGGLCSIDISRLSKGVYVLKAISSGIVSTQRFVIE